ncbi:hypothetical protein GW17_00032624 [Ensete ventricosum]|nr:hypothetical protein GW17_00032624 [Ensete ventricosum]
MARLVRCPKCHKLLVEYPNVPVYQCGGCGIALRGKFFLSSSSIDAILMLSFDENSCSAAKNQDETAPHVDHPESQSDHGFSDSGSASSVVRATAPANMHDLEEDRGGKGIEGGGSAAGRASSSRVEDENEQVENTPKADLASQVERSSRSVGHSIASEEEDTAGTARDEGIYDALKSPATMSSHAYDGSVSSSDDGRSARHLAKSRRTFKAASAVPNLESRHLAPNPSNERNGPRAMRGFNAIGDGSSSKCGSDEVGERSSFNSDEFQSTLNWMAPESTHLHDNVELLRKLDEVRDHLAKFCVADAVQARNATVPRRHFSDQQAYCSCSRCLQGRRPHAASVHDLPSRSSRSASLHKHDGHESERYRPEDKPKRHCRPVSGASPFVICDKCTKLLQLPADFLVSRRRAHKLRCGGCHEVLSLPFPAMARAHSEAVPPSSDEVEGHNEAELGRDANSMAAPQLHRLMGYQSASDLLYEPHEDTSTVPHSLRASEAGRAGSEFRGTGSSSPSHEEGESPRRSRRAGLPRPGMRREKTGSQI